LAKVSAPEVILTVLEVVPDRSRLLIFRAARSVIVRFADTALIVSLVASAKVAVLIVLVPL
jgi:hypothetical protein